MAWIAITRRPFARRTVRYASDMIVIGALL